MFSAYP
jgi:hypothetical protein